jgi:hypothetical protein
MSDSASRQNSRQKGSPPSDRRPDSGRPAVRRHAEADSGGDTYPRVTSRTRRARDVLARDLFPLDESSARTATLAVVAVVAAVVAVTRLGSEGMNTVWAEDGQVFYAGAKNASLPHVFFHAYLGYMDAAPRVIAAIDALFPVKWAASSIAISDAVALGLLAAVVYRAAQAQIQRPWLRVIPALLVAACPVGQETFGSIANLQWSMFFVAFAVLLWNPQRPVPIAVGAVTVAFTTLTSPFGLLLVPVAVVRALMFRRNRAAVIPLCTLAGVGIQGLVMAYASGRQAYYTVLVGRLTRLFLAGVTGQGFFGRHYQAAWMALGTVVVVAVAVAWALIAVMGLPRQFAVASLALIYSLGYFAAPVVLSGMSYRQSTRYFVGPLLLIVFAVVILLDGALNLQNRFRWTGSCRPAAVILCTGLLACVGYTAVTSWRTPDPYRARPTWSAALAAARAQCSRGASSATLPITPVSALHWRVVLSCSQIRDG